MSSIQELGTVRFGKYKSRNMEETHCLFKGKKSRCRSSPRKDLPLLMCELHLKQYFGLEVGYVEIDDVSNVGLTGGMLKPVRNMIISRNQVIVPTKNFFDMTYRSEDLADKNSLTSKYAMSNRIVETVREYATHFPDSMEHRQVIEMYRNFMDTKVDPGQNQKDELAKLQALVEANKIRSEVYIRNQPVSKTLGDNYVYINDAEMRITNDKWSVNFQYFLNNCLYSEMQFQSKGKQYSQYLPFNVQFVDDVGLVATEQIADPMFLIIDGRCVGSQIFYNAHVSLLPKLVQDSRFTMKDFPRQYILNERFKGGIC